MSHNDSGRTKAWTRPEAQRLGRIRDVAGTKNGADVNGSNLNRS